MLQRSQYVVERKSPESLCAEIIQKTAGHHVRISEFFAVQCGRLTEDAYFPIGAGDNPPATTTALRHRRSKRKAVYIDTSSCRYNVVRCASAKVGWEECHETGPVHVVWVDTSLSENRISKLPRGARINHFPGMTTICRKVDSARLLNKMKRLHPESYRFVPSTFFNYNDFLRTKKGVGGDKWYIVKPDSGCMGKGIRLTHAPKKEMFDNAVVQSYVADPLLIDGCKWDMRVYVLVLSVDPLKMYIYKDGFIRMCTEKYHAPNMANAENTLIHLTNYAIHKKSKKYNSNCKRSFEHLFQHIRGLGHDAEKLWDSISDLAVKTLLSVNEQLKYSYRAAFPGDEDTGGSCFEILGFDVLVDKHMQPWLLEVNHAPSFTCDSGLDYIVKAGLVEETMALLGVELDEEKFKGVPRTPEMKKELLRKFAKRKEEYEAAVVKKFSVIYPSRSETRDIEYDRLLSTIRELAPPPEASLVSPSLHLGLRRTHPSLRPPTEQHRNLTQRRALCPPPKLLRY
eukprot:TRINITY_DN15557_c0_g2_i2.p1 TRINITY_DN15557_c0_g2~~TRINITY_DN15557_c0_g2_i2.p1  ORF type:complete len:512 (+),score=107.03 TRINITY_DN15557_c0_g2_i2:892-2427(+)